MPRFIVLDDNYHRVKHDDNYFIIYDDDDFMKFLVEDEGLDASEKANILYVSPFIKMESGELAWHLFDANFNGITTHWSDPNYILSHSRKSNPRFDDKQIV